MDEARNPYRPGAGTQPPALIGRDSLIHQFRVTVQRALLNKPGKSLIAVGLRGVGKTVLLNRFSEIAQGENLRVCSIEASESQEFEQRLAVRLRKQLLALERSGPTKAIRKALRVLKGFAVHLPDGSAFTLDFEALKGQADSGDLSEDLPDLLIALGEAVQSRTTGFLLSIDEIQYLNEEELSALITAVHRTTQLNLPVVLVGAGLPQLPALAGDAKSYVERLFDFPRITSLSAKDAAAALSIPAADEEVLFTAEALDLIVEHAHGYPYFLQEWGYHVWNQAAGSPITKEDVVTAHAKVTDQLDNNFFLVRFDRLTPKEKQYLRAMAEMGPGPHRSGEIALALGVKVAQVAARRAQLIRKGMVYSPAHGDTAFTVPLFDRYLQRALPDWEP